LRELIEESLSEGPPSHTRQLLERLKSAALSRRNEGLEDTLELCAAMLSPAALVEHVVSPFMEHLGEAWSSGVLAAARIPAITDSVQKLLLDRYGRLRRASRQPTIVFATLQGERHALGSLGAALVAAAHGLSCFHLGADISPHAIAEGAERAGASVIGLSLVAPDLYDCDRQLAELRNRLPEDVEIWLGGRERARPSALPANTLVLDGMQAFERQLEVRYQAAADAR